MRPVHPQNLRVATRGTTREINRRIALNLIRTNQPISRADLARLMGTRRGAVSLLVNELIEEGAIFEGATGEAKRGRKPTFLYIDSRQTVRGGGGHPPDPDLPDGDRPRRPTARERHQLSRPSASRSASWPTWSSGSRRC